MDFSEFLIEWNNDEDSIKVHTSGSTGNPKELYLTKKFVEASALRTNEFFGIQQGSRLHSCVGADFIGGKMMAVRAEIAKAKFSFETPSNRPLQNLKHTTELDLVAVVPSQVPFILENLESIPQINNLLIGGSFIHPELKKKIAESGINAYESYGMTETASHIALRKISKEETPFKLFPGIRISLDKDQCLIIKFEEGTEIVTNDVASLISDSEFYIKGRKDQMIISGGRKINPIDLESRISKYITVPFIITGIPDEKWGEKIILIIEGTTVYPNLKEELRKVLLNWELPKEIYYVESLPKTSNGKLLRIKDLSSLSFSAVDNNLSS